MTLVVHPMGAYASYAFDTAWRREDYDVNKLIKGIKRDQINGYARIRGADGLVRQVDNGNPRQADELFAQWAVRRWATLGRPRAVLVPVPSSSAVTFGAPGAPVRLAERLAALSGGGLQVGHWLRFTRALGKSREGGGTRNSTLLALSMAVSTEASVCDVILIDDVVTTGGHLKAAASKLRNAGCTVEVAIVAASTVWEQHRTPWQVEPFDLEEEVDLDFDF